MRLGAGALAALLAAASLSAQESRPALAGKWCGVIHDGSAGAVARPPARYRFFELELEAVGSRAAGLLTFRDGQAVDVVAVVREGRWEIDWRAGAGDFRPFLHEEPRKSGGEVEASASGSLAGGLPRCRMVRIEPGRVVFANEGCLTSSVLFRASVKDGAQDYPAVFPGGTLFAVPDLGPCTWKLFEDVAAGRKLVAERRVGSGPQVVYWSPPEGTSRPATRPAPASDVSSMRDRERVIHGALRWLRRHQSEDGSWDCDGFRAHCDPKLGDSCGGRGSGTGAHDVGVTGLALLAFLGAGYDSARPGEFLDTVRNGLKYLKSNQDAEGCFGPVTDSRHLYAHGFATLAMSEAFAASRQLPWRKSADKGVLYIAACQNPYKGWRYGKRPGDNDSHMTGWMLLALAAARDAGIPVPERGASDGLALLQSLTDEDTGRTGYIKKGERPVRPEDQAGRFPASESESLTALALCAHLAWDRWDSPLLLAGAELVAKKPPLWDDVRGSIDFDYWYCGTRARWELGGQEWVTWDGYLREALMGREVEGGCAQGSWDPKDPWGDEGGRVYATALATLCLEMPYRPRKRFRDQPRPRPLELTETRPEPK
jgi:hypothetical protein